MGNSGWGDDPRGRSRPPYRVERSNPSPRSGLRGWDDDERGGYGSRSGSSGQHRRGPGRDEYSGRDRYVPGGRPPARGDAWEPPSRSGARQPGRGGPGGSNGRGRVPARGGLWDDDAPRQRRPGDPRGRGTGGQHGLRDPRMMRRGLVPDEDEEEEESSLTAGKALLIVVLMFVLGAGGAYGYFKFSTPKVSSDSPTPASTTTPSASPTASPHASPTATPRALAPDAPSRYAVYILPAPML
jgi:hypothetical protein